MFLFLDGFLRGRFVTWTTLHLWTFRYQLDVLTTTLDVSPAVGKFLICDSDTVRISPNLSYILCRPVAKRRGR